MKTTFLVTGISDKKTAEDILSDLAKVTVVSTKETPDGLTVTVKYTEPTTKDAIVEALSKPGFKVSIEHWVIKTPVYGKRQA